MSHLGNPYAPLRLRESGLWLSDNAVGDVSTSRHGFVPKLPNDATKYLDGTGAYTTPPGSTLIVSNPFDNVPTSPANEDDEFDTGSSIDTPGTRRVSAVAWTARLVTGLTNSVSGGELILTLPQTSSVIIEGYTQPFPGVGDCEYRTHFDFDSVLGTNFHSMVFFVDRGTGGSRKSYQVVFGNHNSLGPQRLGIDTKTTDADTFNSTVVNLNPLGFFLLSPLYLGLSLVGSTLTFTYAIGSSTVLRTLFSVSTATFLGARPDTIGVGMVSANASGGSAVGRVKWFRRIS